MNLQQTGKIDKGWGFEIIFANNEMYCGKLLVFNNYGSKTSMVLHKEKFKSWFINSGRFKIKYIELASGETKEMILSEGQTVDFGELSPHQVEALEENSVILEVGTPDYVEDRFRISPGDTQTQSSDFQSNPT